MATTSRNDTANTVFCDEPGAYGIERGLSKKEYAAIHIMAGLCAKYSMSTPEDQVTLSKLSVELSDSLFNELEKD